MAQPTTQQDYDYYKGKLDNSYRGGTGKTYTAFQIEQMNKERAGLRTNADRLWKQLQTEKADAWKVDPNNPEVKAEASWKEAMGLLQKQGPYTPEVVNQLTNRRADQTAAAEAVNAEEIRNQAAARGMDPTQAIRGLQQGRQAQNVAFSGDIASRAAVDNFAAETPGRMMAAQANLNRQFGGATQNAVNGGGGNWSVTTAARQPQLTSTAFSGNQGVTPPSKPLPLPQKQPMSVADRNAAQAAWDKSTNYGRAVYGAGHQPGMSGTGRDAKGNLINPTGVAKQAQIAPTAAANAPAPMITPQQQDAVDKQNMAAGVKVKINTAFNPLAGQYPQGSRTLPMTNPFNAFK